MYFPLKQAVFNSCSSVAKHWKTRVIYLICLLIDLQTLCLSRESQLRNNLWRSLWESRGSSPLSSPSLGLRSIPRLRPVDTGDVHSLARRSSVPLNPRGLPWTPERTQRIHWKAKSEGRQFLRRRTMGVLLHLAHPFILGRPQGTQLFGHCDMGQSFRRRIAFN